jgi:hypothetical protein
VPERTPEFGGSQKGQSLISAYQSLAITTNTPGFEKLNTALTLDNVPPFFLSSYILRRPHNFAKSLPYFCPM